MKKESIVRTKEESMRDILNSAELMFADKGFYGARIDKIAEQANINKRMIYVYFGEKEELYKQVLFNVYQRMEQVEAQLLKQTFEGKKLIEKIIEVYFDFLHNNPSFVRILMWENLNKAQYLNELQDVFVERKTIKLIKEALVKGKQQGVFKQEIDETETVISLITICFGNFSNQYTLSKLFHKDLKNQQSILERRQYVTNMMLAYICN